MWNYTDKVREHFANPRNVGKMENPDAVGEVGSMACGDMLRLFLKIDENDRITDATFQTFWLRQRHRLQLRPYRAYPGA